MAYIIAYDLGTGGIKASLFDELGSSLASTFRQYDTYYDGALIHEQRPADWYAGVIASTKSLMEKSGAAASDIAGISISGHSLGVVPVDKDGQLLLEKTPIWSDARAREEAKRFFSGYSYEDWYMKTGNGFPAELYSIFKIMWVQKNMPQVYAQTYKFLGTKDYINYCLTGNMLTDYSYASGSGVYNLMNWDYDSDLISASRVDKSKLADIIASTDVVGKLSKQAATDTGLMEGTNVYCGGVDNSCMAMGASCYKQGRVYTSLGSSAWIAVSSGKPIVDLDVRPFVFANLAPGQFASAVSIFSAGSSYRWVRDNLCKDLVMQAADENVDVYDLMEQLAKTSPIGANNLVFNPSLSGGSSFEPSQDIKGGFAGLILGHTREDILRATLEGIALNLGVVYEMLADLCKLSDDMIFVGGGSKSAIWRQIFADVYNCRIIKSNIDQDAASLGAMSAAAVGSGMWADFTKIDDAHNIEDIKAPIKENVAKYAEQKTLFKQTRNNFAQIGDIIIKCSK